MPAIVSLVRIDLIEAEACIKTTDLENNWINARPHPQASSRLIRGFVESSEAATGSGN